MIIKVLLMLHNQVQFTYLYILNINTEFLLCKYDSHSGY